MDQRTTRGRVILNIEGVRMVYGRLPNEGQIQNEDQVQEENLEFEAENITQSLHDMSIGRFFSSDISIVYNLLLFYYSFV